jgi:hypothetical protein
MKLVDEKLLDEFRHKPRCERCGKPPDRGMLLDPHHLMARGQGQSQRADIPQNLIALCRACHTSAEYCYQTMREVWGIVALRECCTEDDIKQAVWLVRRNP